VRLPSPCSFLPEGSRLSPVVFLLSVKVKCGCLFLLCARQTARHADGPRGGLPVIRGYPDMAQVGRAGVGILWDERARLRGALSYL
jgi:hypothetical protein